MIHHFGEGEGRRLRAELLALSSGNRGDLASHAVKSKEIWYSWVVLNHRPPEPQSGSRSIYRPADLLFTILIA